MDTLNELIEKTYELQGLLTLLQGNSTPPAGLRDLVCRKAEQINSLAARLKGEPSDSSSGSDAELSSYSLPEEPEEQVEPGKREVRFTINDRFRFTRALFNGDGRLFNSFCDSIATLDSLRDVESFCYSELGWDKGNQDVADLMELIRISGKWAD